MQAKKGWTGEQIVYSELTWHSLKDIGHAQRLSLFYEHKPNKKNWNTEGFFSNWQDKLKLIKSDAVLSTAVYNTRKTLINNPII